MFRLVLGSGFCLSWSAGSSSSFINHNNVLDTEPSSGTSENWLKQCTERVWIGVCIVNKIIALVLLCSNGLGPFFSSSSWIGIFLFSFCFSTKTIICITWNQLPKFSGVPNQLPVWFSDTLDVRSDKKNQYYHLVLVLVTATYQQLDMYRQPSNLLKILISQR